MSLTDNDNVGTIQGGEGGVTKGDIDLLFEDTDNELRELVSIVSRFKFSIAKLASKMQALAEQYEYHVAGEVPRASKPLQDLGGTDGSRGTGGRASGRQTVRQTQLFDRPSRATQQKGKAPTGAAAEAKKEEE